VPRPITPGSGAFVALIAALMTMTAMTIDINLPAIPVTARELDAGLTTAQITVSVFFGGFALGQLFWGALSDRVGRRPAVLSGILLYEVATLGCALAPDIQTLLALRVVQGLGAGSGAVLGRAIIRDLFEGPKMARMLSLALAAFITAPIVAPTIGAVILGLAGWRWIFGFLAVYGAVLLALAALFLEESLKVPDPRALRLGRLAEAFAAVFRDPRSRGWAVVVVAIFGALTVYLVNASVVLMVDHGMSASAFGAAFALVAVCSSAGNLLNARLVRRFALPRLIRGALVAAALAAALTLGLELTGFGGVWALVLALGLFFTAFGLVAANGTALALEPHAAAAGSAAAALGFVQTVLPALVASGVAGLHDGTSVPMLGAILGLVLAGWLVAARIPAPDPAAEPRHAARCST
jgi:DHA1 family bicyclomycin/chloramphenicol resistance-like MFS transporter